MKSADQDTVPFQLSLCDHTGPQQGSDVGASEDGAFWLAFPRSLVARRLGGVQLVTSDAHRGLKEAIATVFAGACWQRCRTL